MPLPTEHDKIQLWTLAKAQGDTKDKVLAYAEEHSPDLLIIGRSLGSRLKKVGTPLCASMHALNSILQQATMADDDSCLWPTCALVDRRRLPLVAPSAIT